MKSPVDKIEDLLGIKPRRWHASEQGVDIMGISYFVCSRCGEKFSEPDDHSDHIDATVPCERGNIEKPD